MFTPKTYTGKCNVCGKINQEITDFYSVSLRLLHSDGNHYPVMNCRDANGKIFHSREEIRSAWARRAAGR